MRKILSGFLATSMIVAVASATTFAASPTYATTLSDYSYSSGNIVTTTGGPLTAKDSVASTQGPSDSDTVDYSADFEIGDISYDVTYNSKSIKSGTVASGMSEKFSGKVTFTNGDDNSQVAEIKATPASVSASYSAADIAKKVASAIGQVTIEDGGNTYVLKASASGKDVVLTSTSNVMPAGIQVNVEYTPSLKNVNLPRNNTATDLTGNTGATSGATTTFALTPPIRITNFATPSTASGDKYADVETAGTLTNYPIDSVVVCDGSGNPIVFTENKDGVDEDQNSSDGVQSAKTLYFLLRDNGPVPKLDDDTFWKLKVTKGDNGKYIKAISDVSKTFNTGLYALESTVKDSRTVGRHRYIKVELNDIYTDDEYKMTLDLRISAKSKAVNAGLEIGGVKVTDDTELKVKDFYFYMKNLVKDADNDWKVGIDGLMLNPLENDWNDVTWYDEDGDVAHMKFFADSDVGKFYSKLSTKWEHADYASYFNDQDAFIFNFTGSPKLSSTSRADLEIYNPFVDEDGNTTIDPATAVIYQVIDGDLYDVTDSFEYKEGENGDMAYVTRTRFLGTYIICEKAVEEAVADETVPDELTPDTTEAPEDVTPDSNAGGKQPANTGKYL